MYNSKRKVLKIKKGQLGVPPGLQNMADEEAADDSKLFKILFLKRSETTTKHAFCRPDITEVTH